MFWELMLIFDGEGYSFIILYTLYNFTCDVYGKFWSSDMVVMRFKDNYWIDIFKFTPSGFV